MPPEKKKGGLDALTEKSQPGTFPKEVQDAAQKSNRIADRPAFEFRDRPDLNREAGTAYVPGGDFYGDDNKRIESGFAQKALKDLLPDGTDRLIQMTKDNVRRGIGLNRMKP